MTTRIYLPAGTVVFDRTGGHLIPLRADVVVDDARLETASGEYVYTLASGRTYSIAADKAAVLPAAEDEDDLAAEFCPVCYEHHGCCTCPPRERPAKEHIDPAVAAVLVAEEAAEAAGRTFTQAEADAVYRAAKGL